MANTTSGPRRRSDPPIPRAGRSAEWPYEREGYSDIPSPAYASAPSLNVTPPSNSGRLEAFLGSVLAGCGAVWTAQVVTSTGLSPTALTLNSHPIELTGLGVLLWLHGKWRRSTLVR